MRSICVRLTADATSISDVLGRYECPLGGTKGHGGGSGLVQVGRSGFDLSERHYDWRDHERHSDKRTHGPGAGFDTDNLAGTIAAGPCGPCLAGERPLGGPATGDPFQNVTQEMENLTETRFRTADQSLWNGSAT